MNNPRLVSLPWGLLGETLEFQTPAAWPVPTLFWPNLEGSVADYASELDTALDQPLKAPALEAHLKPGGRIAIVVDDPSRWTPVAEALGRLLPRLHQAGVKAEEITIAAGVGRHHAVDEAAMRRRVGDSVVERYRCLSPPVDDLSQYVDLGTTPEGVPVRVFRPVAEADLRILIGSVLPHLQAGFGGGYKLIFPGTSHRSTLSALHRQGIDAGEAGKRLGEDASVNPMRKVIRQAASRLGPCLSLSHLLGAPGQVFEVRFGHPDAVQDDLASLARSRFQAPATAPVDLLVAGNNPWPGDPMQSFKVLLNHRAAVKRGGVMVGFFWATEAELDRSFPLPAMKAIARSGAFGGWTIRQGLTLADRALSTFHPPSEFMVRWARELVVDRVILIYCPLLRERVGAHLGPIRIYNDLDRLWRDAAEALGSVVEPSIRIFPQAGLTYVPEPSA